LLVLYLGRAGDILSQISKPRKNLNRLERRHQVKQFRDAKKVSNKSKKGKLGVAGQPPFLVTVVRLSAHIRSEQIMAAMQEADSSAKVTESQQGNIHIR